MSVFSDYRFAIQPPSVLSFSVSDSTAVSDSASASQIYIISVHESTAVSDVGSLNRIGPSQPSLLVFDSMRVIDGVSLTESFLPPPPPSTGGFVPAAGQYGIRLYLTVGGQQMDYTKYLDQTTVAITEQINYPTQFTFSLTPSDGTFVAPVQRAYVQLWSMRWQRSLFTGYVASEPVRNYLGLSQYAPTPNTAGPAFTVNALQLTAWLQRAAGITLGTPDQWCKGMNILIPGTCPGLSNAVLIQLGMKPDSSNRGSLPPVDAQTFLNVINANAPPPGPTNIGPSTQDESVLGRRQLFRYDVTATSDEYLLNMKAVPFIPSYINRSQGAILTDIADTLCPGFFDMTLVASGDLVPFYAYDPTQSWCEIAKTFADGSRYRYKVRDKQIVYQPYADEPLGIEYDEIRNSGSSFDPSGLQTTVMTVPIVNDVTIIGDIEAGNNHEDYFIGDGFTGNFGLRHRVFRGSSVVVAQDAWSESEFDTSNWFVNDAGTNFFLAGALNVITPASGAFPTFGGITGSYIQLLNGVELAGGLNLQHGEFTFEDYCQGVVGGLYTDESFSGGSFLCGFVLSSPAGVITSASGASGVVIQPTFGTSGIGPGVISKPNHTYVLQTVISAPKYSRYNKTYRTLDGEEFGGLSEVALSGSVTFNISEYDIAAATGFYYQPNVYQYTIQNVDVPPFGLYAIVNNQQLNLTIVNSLVESMPLGALTAYLGPSGLYQPSGLILPMLPSDSGDYIGPVEPWPGMAPSAILLPPGALATGHTVLVLGNGYDVNIAAQITAGNSADTLAFYSATLPAAGTPIRFQSWEAQAAISRLQDPESITNEAFIVGDDGIRSAIVTDLNPLPRTSEDCDNAALAFLQDRTTVFYNGTYTITSFNFEGITSDLQFWPCVGRFLNVNAPRREIYDQQFLVTSLTIKILDMLSELVQYQIGFGADTHLEKVLKNFVNLNPPSVLTPQDQANPPNPRYIQQVDTSFLPDLSNVQVERITDTTITVHVIDNYQGLIEIRKQDNGWGKGPNFGYVTTVIGQFFTLPRLQFDQTWYMRPIARDAYDQPVLSRRSKVIRIYYPLKPSPPLFRYAVQVQAPTSPGQTTTTLAFQLDYNGDQRSIYGLEVRAADDETILVQRPVASYADLYVDLSQTPFLTLSGGLAYNYNLTARFFNQQWSMSDRLLLGPSLEATHSPYVWSPGYAQPVTGDAYFAASGFGIRQDYVDKADGSVASYLEISGIPSPNQISQVIDAPIIVAASASNSLSASGMIPTGDYSFGVCAFDKYALGSLDYNCTDLSNLVTVHVSKPASAITIGIEWDQGSYGGGVFVATPDSSQGWHNEANVFAQTTAGLPKTITLTQIKGISYGAPDSAANNFYVQYKRVLHSGIWAEQVQAVTSGTLTFGFAAGSGGFIPNSLTGRVFSMLAKMDYTQQIPICDIVAASNTSGVITFGPNPYTGVPLPDLTTIFQVGDLVACRMAPTNITPLGFDDPLIINNYEPNGMAPSGEIGRLAWVLGGPGAGSVAQISSNGASGVRFSTPWSGKTLPTSGSLIVIVDPTFAPPTPVQPYMSRNWQSFSGIVALPEVNNLGASTWIVEVLLQNALGQLSIGNNAFREIYLWGSGVIGTGNTAPFAVEAQGYAMLTVVNLGLATSGNISQLREIDFFAPSIDETDVGLWAMGTIDNNIDTSITIPVQINNGSRYTDPNTNQPLTFNVGDYIIWNDPPNYEINQIAEIVEGNTFALQRTNQYSATGQAMFGSLLNVHTNKKFYRLIPRKFNEPVIQGAIGTDNPIYNNGVPPFWEWAWANKCVASVVSQVLTTSALPEVGLQVATYTLNLGGGEGRGSSTPGLRTMNGAAYMLGVPGPLLVGLTASMRAKVQAWESLRAIYGVLTTPGIGSVAYNGIFKQSSAAVVAYVVYIQSLQSTPHGLEQERQVAILAQLNFTDNSFNSYLSSDPPDGRQMPYDLSWPPNELGVVSTLNAQSQIVLPFTNPLGTIIFSPDGDIDIIVVQVGSSTAGSNLSVVVQT
jgi:hypothetical protein